MRIDAALAARPAANVLLVQMAFYRGIGSGYQFRLWWRSLGDTSWTPRPDGPRRCESPGGGGATGESGDPKPVRGVGRFDAPTGTAVERSGAEPDHAWERAGDDLAIGVGRRVRRRHALRVAPRQQRQALSAALFDLALRVAPMVTCTAPFPGAATAARRETTMAVIARAARAR